MNRIADLIGYVGCVVIYSILILALVVMSSLPASAHEGNNSNNQTNGCHQAHGQHAHLGYHCHPNGDDSDGWDWGGVAVVIGAAIIIHVLAGDDSPWAYSPAPPDPDAIDWGFNVTPDETTVTLDIPISF